MVMTERELCQQRQILAAYLMIAAYDATLEQSPEALNRVSMDGSANVLLCSVIDDFVRHPEVAIGWIFIGNDKFDFAARDLANEAVIREVGRLTYHLADDVAFAADGSNNAFFQIAFARSSQPLLAGFLILMAIAVFAANICLINFNNAKKLLELVVVHGGADAGTHIPDGFVAGLVVKDHALDLQGAHAFLRVKHHEGDLKPNLQGILCILKDRATDNAKTITFLGALMALPMVGLMLECVDFLIPAARAAYAIRPAMFDQKIAASVFSLEHRHHLAQLHHVRILPLWVSSVNYRIIP